ncbi:hypothetical protein AAVH_29274 [Aphelenchoides avenae]|nr:hypothetical protein AAVH_29274 [Aphelenchus avenae]
MSISELAIEKANLQEEVVNGRSESAQLREEKDTLLLEKQAYEECLRNLEDQVEKEKEDKEDAEDESASLRRKCSALEANVDSLSTQLAGLSAVNAELTKVKADLEVSKSLAESKVVEHMREKTASERQRDKLAADNRKLTTESTELKKVYGRSSHIKRIKSGNGKIELLIEKKQREREIVELKESKNCPSGIGPLNICRCHYAPEFDVDLRGHQQYGALLASAGKSFYPPAGALKYGLSVRGRYNGGDAWMGPPNAAGSWAVAYHGTTRENAVNIIKYGFHLDKCRRISYGPGIYCTPDPNTAAGDYAVVFTDNVKTHGKRYRVVIEVRVDPSKLKSVVSTNLVKNEYWLVPDASGIRPFAVCVFDA